MSGVHDTRRLAQRNLDVGCEYDRENERTPAPNRVFGVRLHSMGLSVRGSLPCWSYSGLTALMAQSGGGRIGFQRPRATR